jgi:hypothetical protein
MFCSTMIFVVSLFSNGFSLGANKEDLLHVTHYVISSLLFSWHSYFSRLFEHEMSFLCLGMNIYFSFTMIYLKCYTPSDVHLIMSTFYENKWLKKLMNQKRKDILFSSMYFLCFKNFGYKIIFICVLIIWLNASHHYYKVHVLWYQPIYTFTKMFSMTWIFIFQKK